MTDELKGCGRKQSWPNQGTFRAFPWRYWWKTWKHQSGLSDTSQDPNIGMSWIYIYIDTPT